MRHDGMRSVGRLAKLAFVGQFLRLTHEASTILFLEPTALGKRHLHKGTNVGVVFIADGKVEPVTIDSPHQPLRQTEIIATMDNKRNAGFSLQENGNM